MPDDRRPVPLLLIGAIILVVLFLLFPGVVGAVVSVVGTLVCCFLVVILAFIILVVVFGVFSIPWAKKPPQQPGYTNYRAEDVSEGPFNNGGPDQP